MRYLFLLLCFLAIRSQAQNSLKFNKLFVQSEDKWIAFPPGEDSVYDFGFIYIDPEAGLTLHYEGSFKILSNGVFIPKKVDTAIIKVRLEPNEVMVAFIPEGKFGELGIQAIPEWLQSYKTDSNSIDRLYNWGFMYNGWGECEKALSYLERANKINPKYEGLAVELSYSYNCLERYTDAEAILAEEIKSNPRNAYVSKEYIYTLTKIKKVDLAIAQFEKAKTTIADKQYDAENCYNILQYFYYQKDKENFSKWYKILQSQPNIHEMITKYAENIKSNLER